MMRWLNGESYTGYFRNGVKHGFGTTMWKSGEFVSRKGIYKDGKMCGAFKSVKRDGSVFDALYRDDSLVKFLTEDEMKQYTHKNSDRSDRSDRTNSSRTSNSTNSRMSYKQFSSSNSFNRLNTNGVNAANDLNTNASHEGKDTNPANVVNNRNNRSNRNNINKRNNVNNRNSVLNNKGYRGRRTQTKVNES